MNPLRKISGHHSLDVSGAVQASPSYLDKIRQSIEEKDYQQAYKQLLTFLPGIRLTTSTEDVRLAYSFLVEIIPHIDTLTMEKRFPSSRLDQGQLTRLLLCSILTRPGNGCDSNYVVDEEGYD